LAQAQTGNREKIKKLGLPAVCGADRENLLMSDLSHLAESVTVDPLVGHPADYHVFHKFLTRCKKLPAVTTAVCWPLSDVALQGAVEAATAGLIKPTLVGDEAKMKALAAKIGVDISAFPIVRGRLRVKGR
jgi:hypothetical protein